MAELKLYAIALAAKGYDENQAEKITVRPAVCVAENREHAVGKGITWAKNLWPREEHWFDHTAGVTEVPAGMIERVYTQEVTNE